MDNSGIINDDSLCTLFEKWKCEHINEPEYEYKKYCAPGIKKNNFYSDGYLDFTKYQEAKTKVLFVAKESHIDVNEDTDTFWVSAKLKEITDGNCNNTGRIDFLKGLAMLYNDMLYNKNPDSDEPDKTLTCLLETAFINLNKRGGLDTCDSKKLEAYVAKYQYYIKAQIEIINPHIMPCMRMGKLFGSETGS